MIAMAPGALLGALLLGGPATAATVDRVAAVVNDEVVTLSEVYDFAGDYIDQKSGTGKERRAAELEVLDSLIQRELIRQEVERLGIDMGDVEVDRAIDDIARRNNMDREQLREAIQQQGMSWTQYRDEIRESLRQQQFTGYIMQTRISVDEDELRDLYRRQLAENPPPVVLGLGAFTMTVPPGATPEQVAAVVARAEAARARVAGGEDFGAVAREVDEGPFAQLDGRMGEFREGELRADLAGPAFQTETGSTTAPIVTEQGVFVLYVFERRTEAPPAFEDQRAELEQVLYQDRIEDEIEQWTQQARRQSAIEIKLEPAN